MAQVELILPKMGESVAEATVTSWLKNIGDKVEVEDGVFEIATDKVDTEVPSTHQGILIKQLFKVGEIVQVGKTYAILETNEIEIQSVEKNDLKNEVIPDLEIENTNSITQSKQTDFATSNEQKIVEVKLEEKNINSEIKNNQFFSPLVKSIAKKESISIEDLSNISSTGKNNRLTKQDLLSFLEFKKTSSNSIDNQTNTASEIKPIDSPAKSISGVDEIIQMDRMRKLIAENMLRSVQTSPHVSSIVEIDVTNLVLWRNKVKDQFEKREGFKLTFTPLFIEAIAKALRDFPMVNISIKEDTIILKKNINIGIAVALSSGNLIVPVIKNADQLNLIGIAKRANELSLKAKNNKLSPDDIQNGTFTLTNIGTFGNEIGTPIINQPQVAILSTGVIKKKPAVIETPQGDFIGIRHLMYLSLSYDHRVVDGMLGGSFLKRTADYLEKFDFNRLI